MSVSVANPLLPLASLQDADRAVASFVRRPARMADYEPLSHPAGQRSRALPLAVAHLGEVDGMVGQHFQIEAVPHSTLVLVLSGAVRITQDGRVVEATAGEVAVIRPGQPAQVTVISGPMRRVDLTLTGRLAVPLLAEMPDHLIPAPGVHLANEADHLLALLRAREPDHHIRASCAAYHLLLNLVPRPTHHAAIGNPTVAAALRILETSGARDLDMRQVALAVGTSVSHLHRLFKQAVGTSPLKYARDLLVEQAKHALGNTSLSCQEIARRLGWDDPLYFSAVFRRVVGVSPREYRKRHR